jgi:glycosyltransferase involved in cell wall biosynthesis
MQHLFRQIMPDYPVVWVNSFGHRVPRVTLYDLKRAAAKLRAMVWGSAGSGEPGLLQERPAALVEPKALPWHHVPLVHALNTRSLLWDTRRALQRVAPSRPPVLVTGTPAAAGVVGALGEQASIYFCMDNYAELPGVSRTLVDPLERALLGKVGAVVATAAALQESKRPASARAFYLPQGVNFEHFATPQPLPPELARLSSPRIGFAGGVSECCDLALIQAVAAANPQGSVVLVGPVSVDLSVLTSPNIHVLGNRPYATLPAYVQAFDVGIIPYVLNDWTRAVDPLKLLEYLAAGIPVVSTPIPEVHKYASVITCASGAAEFARAAVAACAGDRLELRRARQDVARQQTWEQRATQFLTIVRDLCANGAAASRVGDSGKRVLR